MSISRPQPAQDPFSRPGTVAYPAGHAAAGSVSFPQGVPQNQPAQWQQQPPAQQQWAQQAAYNPSAYPPMPGGQQAAAPPAAYHDPQQQNNQRWSVVSLPPGQLPAGFQPGAQPSLVSPPAENIGNPMSPADNRPLSYAPQPPPKDNPAMVNQHGLQPTQGFVQSPPLQQQQFQYQIPATQQPQAHAGYQQPAPTQPDQSLNQNMGHHPLPGSYNPYQGSASQSNGPVPQHLPPSAAPPQPFQGYQYGQPASQGQFPPGFNEPVSPVQHNRHHPSVDHSMASGIPSRTGSNHTPSRASSINTHNRISTPPMPSPPRQDKRMASPADGRTGLLAAPPKRVMDPNGIGRTGATALGMGGPSDWENFGSGEFEVDDLALYATKRPDEKKEPALESTPEEKPTGPVELPAGSPVETRTGPWQVEGQVAEVEGSAVVVPAPNVAQAPQPIIMAPQMAGAPPSGPPGAIDAGVIMMSEPIQSVPAGQPAPPQMTPGQHAAPHGPGQMGHQQPPQQTANSFIMDDGSGWIPPPQGPPAVDPQAGQQQHQQQQHQQQQQQQIQQQQQQIQHAQNVPQNAPQPGVPQQNVQYQNAPPQNVSQQSGPPQNVPHQGVPQQHMPQQNVPQPGQPPNSFVVDERGQWVPAPNQGQANVTHHAPVPPTNPPAQGGPPPQHPAPIQPPSGMVISEAGGWVHPPQGMPQGPGAPEQHQQHQPQQHQIQRPSQQHQPQQQPPQQHQQPQQPQHQQPQHQQPPQHQPPSEHQLHQSPQPPHPSQFQSQPAYQQQGNPQHPQMPPSGAVVMDGGWVKPQQMHGMPGSQGQHHGAFATPPVNSFVAADPSGVPPHVHQHPASEAHVAPTSGAAVRSGPAVNDAELKALQAKLQETESELALFKESAVQQRLLHDTNADESNALKDKIARLQTECQSAQLEVQNLERSLEHAERASVVAANERANFDKEKEMLQSKILDLETAAGMIASEQEAANADVAMRLSAAEAVHATLKSDLESANAKLAEAEKIAAQSQSEIETLKKELEAEKAKPTDFAPGLDPWFKGCLERFKAVLYAEAAAPDVKDKIKIFKDFINNECHNRTIGTPFGPNGELLGGPPAVSVPESKPQPSRVEETVGRKTPPQKLPKLNTPSPNEDYVLVEPEQYSPGGRPLSISRPGLPKSLSEGNLVVQPKKGSPTLDPVPETENQGAASSIKPFRPYTPAAGSSVAAENVAQKPAPHRADSVPADMKATAAYVPFKYTPTGPSKPTKRDSKPPVKAFSPAVAPTPAPPAQTQNKRMSVVVPNETFLPPVPDKQKTPAADTPIDAASLPPPLKPKPLQQIQPAQPPQVAPQPHAPQKVQNRASVLQAPPAAANRPDPNLPPIERLLDILLPVAMPESSVSHPTLEPLYKELSRFTPADFAFIGQLTSTWETASNATRRRLQSERERRREEAEEAPTRMFQDGEIGYKEMSAMENEQRHKEFAELEQESTDEWNGYLNEVFEPVFKKLQCEISELCRIRDIIDKICQESVAGARGLRAQSHGRGGDVALVDALELLEHVHALLEEREREVGKAVAERDRRYKKNVTRTLYLKDNVPEMKRVEAALDKNELKQELGRRHERFANCKVLWKAVKASVKRGVDENDGYAEEILAAAAAVSDSNGNGDEAAAALRRARDVLADAAANSKLLMRRYERVDAKLNEAEFEAMLASERANEAPAHVFEDLKAQKKEQDGQLVAEAAQREGNVDAAYKAWVGRLDGMLERVSGGQEEDEEAEKSRRLKAALEAAKRRNGDA